MGFYIDKNNKVWADHATRDFGDTTADNNPTYDTTHCDAWPMRVTSVFKRFGFKGKGKSIGDNCPFIYGVKRKQGLSVGYRGIVPLVAPMTKILTRFAGECHDRLISFDAVVPMPSSHKITDILAKRAGRALGVPVVELFRQVSSQDVRLAVGNSGFPHKAIVNILNAVNKADASGTAFSLSDVSTRYRHYVNPIARIACNAQFRSILLVDDLFATGQTLIAAKNALYSSIKGLETVESLCLFSPLNGRIHAGGR